MLTQLCLAQVIEIIDYHVHIFSERLLKNLSDQGIVLNQGIYEMTCLDGECLEIDKLRAVMNYPGKIDPTELKKMIEEIGNEHFLFGSDFPFRSGKKYIQELEGELDLEPIALEKIIGLNHTLTSDGFDDDYSDLIHKLEYHPFVGPNRASDHYDYIVGRKEHH